MRLCVGAVLDSNPFSGFSWNRWLAQSRVTYLCTHHYNHVRYRRRCVVNAAFSAYYVHSVFVYWRRAERERRRVGVRESEDTLHRETVAMLHTATVLRNWRCIRLRCLCVRVQKSNFWENSFTTFSLVPVSRASIQAYLTQVKITIPYFVCVFFFLYFSFLFIYIVFPFFRFSARFVAKQCPGITDFVSGVAGGCFVYICVSFIVFVCVARRTRSTIFICVKVLNLLILPCAFASN